MPVAGLFSQHQAGSTNGRWSGDSLCHVVVAHPEQLTSEALQARSVGISTVVNALADRSWLQRIPSSFVAGCAVTLRAEGGM